VTNSMPALISHETDSTIDVGDVVSLLRRRAAVIIAVVLVATIIAIVAVLFATPEFTAEGALYLGDAQTSGADATASSSSDIGVFSDFPNTSDVATQIDLITATGMLQQAVLETGLNTEMFPTGTKKLNYMRWQFGYRGRITAFAPGPQSLQALFASEPGSYSVVLGADSSYTIFKRGGLLDKPKFVLTGTLGQPASGNGVQILIKPAGTNFQALSGESYDLTVTSPVTTAESLLGHGLTVTPSGKIANVSFQWSDPYKAQAFLSQLLQDFIASQLVWKTQSASTTEKFISDQLANVSVSLAAADKDLAGYQSKTGIVDVDQSSQDITSKLLSFRNQRLTLQLQQEALQKFADDFASSKGQFNPYLVSQSNDTLLSGLTTSLSQAEVDLTQKEVQYTSASPEVRLAQAKVADLQNSIETIVRNNLSAVNQSLASLDKMIGEFQEQIKDMPAESLKVVSYQRSTDVLGKLYVLLMQRKEEAEIAKAATIINTRIVTPVGVPPVSTTPKASIYIISGAAAGLVAALALVFGQRAMSGRFESEHEIRKSIPLRLYASVPKHGLPDYTANVLGGSRGTPFSEAFRLFRGSIYRRTSPDSSMIIQVISPSHGDGTTTIAENLAKALADDGRRVVLVDGDLRPVKLSEQFRINSLRGMEGVLAGIFARWREEFEFIIVDSPPLPASADGMVLGVFADLILSVVSVSVTRRRSLATHIELLEALDRPHGIVINMVEARDEARERAGIFGVNWPKYRALLGLGGPKPDEERPKGTSIVSISLSEFGENKLK